MYARMLLVVAVLLWFVSWVPIEAQCAQLASRAPGFEVIPDGWEVVREVEVPSAHLSQFSKKLTAPVTALFNTVVRFDNNELKINTLSSSSVAAATQLKSVLRKGKSNPRWVVQNEKHVYEFIVQTAEHARLASQARYAFAIQPRQAKYRIEFDAVPIQGEREGIGTDDRNRLFNLLLSPSKPNSSTDIDALAKRFEFARQIELVGNLQNAMTLDWSSKATEVAAAPGNAENVTLRLVSPSQVFGMPSIHLTAEVSIDISKPRVPAGELNRVANLGGNLRFPIGDKDVQSVVHAMIKPGESDSTKVHKLLNWFSDSKNMRYEGLTGSRYGTKTAFQQHFGRCWDYSDLFVTMSRIAGLPCRQVFGWLYESEGHVWCDVLVDGKWQMVDPTSGSTCGSDYLPICCSTSGEFPLIYASLPAISQQ